MIRLQWRPFRFALPQPLATAAGTVHQRCGWLLRLQGEQGGLGWGEAAPLDGWLAPVAEAIEALGSACTRNGLEAALAAIAETAALAVTLLSTPTPTSRVRVALGAAGVALRVTPQLMLLAAAGAGALVF